MTAGAKALEHAQPDTAVVLGSGLGSVVEAFDVRSEVAYAEIEGLSPATVPGHAGRFVLARLHDRPLLFALGRRHLYEGISAREVSAGIRFMHSIGVRRVILTNAAGAINRSFSLGGFMVIRDHLNLMGQSPLTGAATFCDMSEAYSLSLRARLQQAGEELGMPLHEGVYAAVLGPQYETPAEIRMLSLLGADAVGMSTVPETVQARALGMEVAGISALTNWAAGVSDAPLNHAEVMAAGRLAGCQLAALLKRSL